MKTYSRTANAMITVNENTTVKFTKRDGKTVFWESLRGGQSMMLMSQTDEVLAGGERGSGMTQGLLAWFAIGDLGLPSDDPAHHSYFLDPSFRGLLLSRYTSEHLFSEELLEMYGPLGGRVNLEFATISFPSGARLIFRDIDTPLKKLRGSFTKIGIDGLCSIQRQKRYLRLISQLRNVRLTKAGTLRTPLHCRVMSTTACDGPGVEWVFQRFVSVKDKSGNLIAPGKVMRDQASGITRTYIPMKFEENFYLNKNAMYKGMMLAQNEQLRRAWINGDWQAFMPGELDNA